MTTRYSAPTSRLDREVEHQGSTDTPASLAPRLSQGDQRGGAGEGILSPSLPVAGMAHGQAILGKGVSVTVHGHFYQPPRENPYLNSIERQPSAAPDPNWNARINRECYRPNAFARIFNDQGEVLAIVNNFEYLSFNIGPTLMSWLEQYDPEVYGRILEADRLSCERLEGHGNAIAQVYNHIIMPLANERDRRTQIRWGIADFRHRFGRDPEGMWLAETAVDYDTLVALVEEGIRYTILDISQVERIRPLTPRPENGEAPVASPPPWQDVSKGTIDPRRPYRCFLPASDSAPANSPPRWIDIFFYDGPISRSMGFESLLTSSERFAQRLSQAVQGPKAAGEPIPPQLIAVATDGETFGHHRRNAERCLAYAFVKEFPARGWQVTNFGHYLAHHPPSWEAQIKPATAWSCCHGVDRWQDDCGCGREKGTQQRWRRPLREGLNALRDRLIPLYEREASTVLRDPWAARDAYIQVILDRASGLRWGQEVAQGTGFWRSHQRHELSATEQTKALRLLEMQRHCLLMFTSCGWFFEELSRPEGVQILRYAARAIELGRLVSGEDWEAEFLDYLAQAPCNCPDFASGRKVYEQLVRPAQVSLEAIAAQVLLQTVVLQTVTDQPLPPLASSSAFPSAVPSVASGAIATPTLSTLEGDLDGSRWGHPHRALPQETPQNITQPTTLAPSSSGQPVPATSPLATAPLATPPLAPSNLGYRLYGHQIETLDCHLRRLGSSTLAIAHLHIQSDATQETRDLILAALHLGSWDFYGCIQPFQDAQAYNDLRQTLLSRLDNGSAAEAMLALNDLFQGQRFSFADLVPEARQDLMARLSAGTLGCLDQLYTQIYRDNYSLLLALHRDQLPIPRELQGAADVALTYRLTLTIQALERLLLTTPDYFQPLAELTALATEAQQVGGQIDLGEARLRLEALILRWLTLILASLEERAYRFDHAPALNTPTLNTPALNGSALNGSALNGSALNSSALNTTLPHLIQSPPAPLPAPSLHGIASLAQLLVSTHQLLGPHSLTPLSLDRPQELLWRFVQTHPEWSADGDLLQLMRLFGLSVGS